jgi:hypothetical protein
MNPIVETNILGWVECLVLTGALVVTIAAWRWAPVGPARPLRLLPAGWAGIALGADLLVAALAFVHGSVPMVARLAQRADRLGLYLASAALLLALVQIAAAWLGPQIGKSRWLMGVTVANLGLITGLGIAHLLLNAGNLTSLGG